MTLDKGMAHKGGCHHFLSELLKKYSQHLSYQANVGCMSLIPFTPKQVDISGRRQFLG